MRKYVMGGVIALLVVACIVFFAVRAGSRDAALRGAGFYPQDCEVLWKGFYNNDDLNEVVRLRSEESRLTTGTLVRNRWGFWSFYKQSERTSPDQHLIGAAWTRFAGIRYFEGRESREVEQHRFYCGDNAQKTVRFLQGQLPDNVTVNIQQVGKDFAVHLIMFTNGEEQNNLDIHTLLVQAGCIPD